MERDAIFGLDAVTSVPQVEERLLVPARAWGDAAAWEAAATALAARFRDNFRGFAAEAGADVRAAGPS